MTYARVARVPPPFPVPALRSMRASVTLSSSKCSLTAEAHSACEAMLAREVRSNKSTATVPPSSSSSPPSSSSCRRCASSGKQGPPLTQHIWSIGPFIWSIHWSIGPFIWSIHLVHSHPRSYTTPPPPSQLDTISMAPLTTNVLSCDHIHHVFTSVSASLKSSE